MPSARDIEWGLYATALLAHNVTSNELESAEADFKAGFDAALKREGIE